MFTNPVVLSILILTVLCLLKVNVIISLIIAALAGGLIADMPVSEIMETLIDGMGGNAETALSYILLGAFAVAFTQTGAADLLTKKLANGLSGKGKVLVFIIAAISCLSQNLILVHIAFIPILIPPLLGVMNKLNIDRRAVATALTFGLKAPYVAIPLGYGLIFHNIIRDQMGLNGMTVTNRMIWQVMWIPGLAMLVGLFISILFTYRKGRTYESQELVTEEVAATTESGNSDRLNKAHVFALIGAVAALVIQIQLKSLPLAALAGILIMILSGAMKFKDLDKFINGGIGMMGFIAFVMLVASGFGSVMTATGGVETLVESTTNIITSKFMGATVMILLGLLITMGIGSSFSTVSIIAAIYIPLATAMDFSVPATILLIGTAAALGDAGSPVSDSTLGPTAGLNADGQHDHIWDTCVPTFLHFNIPLIIFGIIGALLL
ncbi:Na+/H+ antiporter NhaC family protein [Serpentinicella sp. ANB-PHB4]|uniref:Na+/H+ antiporter family protein n=1 Tax=Serpentinicella sp. ANB-PHB4 TaxID=3074076 RepID=UPI0028619A81|nr:Na+/H+ antiporter NhaC family protein [Serpentinicella sp. ANB-PHB4]MDR5658525.1 Na+/H+ antiporter NhaC family protein [Serpentinicella sp. ANB-PHB4]